MELYFLLFSQIHLTLTTQARTIMKVPARVGMHEVTDEVLYRSYSVLLKLPILPFLTTPATPAYALLTLLFQYILCKTCHSSISSDTLVTLAYLLMCLLLQYIPCKTS